MLNIIKFVTFDDLILEARNRIEILVGKIIGEKGFFSMALAGGSTPAPLYSKLAEADLPWDKIHLFWGDERLVPLDSELSNYRMVYEKLISKISIPDENVHVFPVDLDLPPDAAAEYYEAEVKKILLPDLKTLACPAKLATRSRALPAFDLILLGIGPDGHTASLFPCSPALREQEKLVVAVPPPTTVKPAVPRLTFTFPLINAAREKLFLVSGEEKGKLFDSAETYPFKLVKNADIFYAKK